MASMPTIKWPTGRTPSKVEIFAHQHKGGRVALHVVELDTKLIYPAFLLEDMTGHWSSTEGWRSNPFLWVKGNGASSTSRATPPRGRACGRHRTRSAT